jgi:predicted transposase/invertase (TIGR01784 family)
MPPEMVPDIPGKKNSVVDVRCYDNHKRQFIIEMQMKWDDFFYNRILFNGSKAYVRQLERGQNYNLLCPVYTLVILNENFDKKTREFYHHYQIVNLENTDEVIQGLEFVMIELKKFKPVTVSDRKMMVLWLRFLNEVNEKMTALPAALEKEKDIRRAAELCEYAAYTEEERALYDAYWNMVSLEKSFVESAVKKGEAIGIKKGEAKLAEERKKTEAERKKAQEDKETIVLNLSKEDISVEIISKTTGLTKAQINKILQGGSLSSGRKSVPKKSVSGTGKAKKTKQSKTVKSKSSGQPGKHGENISDDTGYDFMGNPTVNLFEDM